MIGTGAPDHPASGGPGIELSPISFSHRSGAPPDTEFVFDARFPDDRYYGPALAGLASLDDEVGHDIRARGG